MKKVLIIPKHIRTIKKNHISLNFNYSVYGCDTETANGVPFMLQINDGKEVYMPYVSKETILDEFLDYFDRISADEDKEHYYIAFFHNLDFDLVALLYNFDLNLFKKTEFEFDYREWTINCYTGKRYFAYFKKRNKTIVLLDSFAYMPTSLEKMARDLHIPFKKLPKPEGLGEKVLHSQEFSEYAKTDVLIEYEVGKWIMSLHEKYDTKFCVSLPQLSMRIFRHRFLNEGDEIKLPNRKIIEAALRSYHGGKNGMYVPAGKYDNCSEIDLNSAYPYAMKMLPSFLEGEYKETKVYRKEYVGIYNIRGKVNCPYNIFFDDEFKPVKEFKDIWITSYELEEAMKYNEADIEILGGYIWIPESNRNPFADYVDYFYEKKQNTPKTDSFYNFYKMAMNSLYGKLIQATELNNDESEKADYETIIDEDGKIKVKRIQKTYSAGGLFNPFIATLITGKVRAMIHELEHKFEALHTATDSIKTLKKISGESKELGGYKLELTGTCFLFRNKMYLHYANDFSRCKHKPEYVKHWYKGQHLCKYALHGFFGNVDNLIELSTNKSNTYQTKHLYKVKEALIQNKTPLKMEELTKNFNFDWSKFH